MALPEKIDHGNGGGEGDGAKSGGHPPLTEPKAPSSSPPGADPARLFIALELPGSALRQVSHLVDDLKKGFAFTSCRPKWVEGERLHLTLRFLGPTSRDRIERIGEELGRIAKEHNPPNLRVLGLEAFPDWRRPRVLWVGVKDKSDSLESLQGEIEAKCARWGYEPEERAYRPHLTLARFKSVKGVGAAKGIVFAHKGFRSERFAPAEIILFESRLTPEGPNYSALARFRLG